MQRYLPILLVLLAVVAQLLPHPFNVSPVAAIGLFAGAVLRPRIAWLVPVTAMLLGQWNADFYPLPVLLFVLTGMLAGPTFGRLLLSTRQNLLRFGGATLGAALLFYLLSNFGIWVAGYYPPNLAGLMDCYLMGLPFLGRSLLADLLYGGVLFGGWVLTRHLLTDRGQRFA